MTIQLRNLKQIDLGKSGLTVVYTMQDDVSGEIRQARRLIRARDIAQEVNAAAYFERHSQVLFEAGEVLTIDQAAQVEAQGQQNLHREALLAVRRVFQASDPTLNKMTQALNAVYDKDLQQKAQVLAFARLFTAGTPSPEDFFTAWALYILLSRELAGMRS